MEATELNVVHKANPRRDFFREKIVVLHLDHLEDSSGGETCDLNQLYSKVACADEGWGTKVTFVIENGMSHKERDLLKFCKEQAKKKRFQCIIEHAALLIEEHPSSAWAHFFYGVACKNVPGKEKCFVSALTHAVVLNPNFLSGWQALYKHFLSQGGLFTEQSHDYMCLLLRALLRLEPNFDNWCGLVGHIWDYITANDFDENRILSLLGPYLSCRCSQREEVVAQLFVNFIRSKKKLLPKSFSPDVLKAFQVLITQRDSELYRMGLLFAAVRYFNRSNDSKRIIELLNFIHVNDVIKWKLTKSKEFAYHLIYELFKAIGPDSLETVTILKQFCGDDILNNSRYFLCDNILKLTSTHRTLLENYNSKKWSQLFWGRLLYIKVLYHLKLYQEVYEQVLEDLRCGVQNSTVEKEYMEILVEILSHAKDPFLQRFSLRLGYKFLKMYGLNVKILHNLCFISISLGDLLTAREVCKCLFSMGAVTDVIYLQSLIEEDEDLKLDYLKSIDYVPAAHLLSAVIYRELGKSKRSLKSMLEASFNFHCGITPLEWLGIHYYERELVVKSTRYFLEAFSNYLVSSVSVNYIICIYLKHCDLYKLRAFFDTLSSRSGITLDVACSVNLKAGLNYMMIPKETLDFHRALEKFRRVTDLVAERKTVELVADALSYFGMHGSASDLYLLCHAENDDCHVYPSVLYGTESKMVKRKGHKYLITTRNVAAKAGKSPLALYTYACAVFDRALSSYFVNNFHHCILLCQEAALIFSRCIAIYSGMSAFWISLGNLLFTVASVHVSFGAIFLPSWLFAQNQESQTMVLVRNQEALVLSLRCYSTALKLCQSEDIRQLIHFYIGLTFRYAKTFYKEAGDRMLYWSLNYALESCDFRSWQRHNLCGVVLGGLNQFKDASEFFKDAMLIGSREDARDAEFNLGVVHLRLGQFIDAHEVFMYRRGNDPLDSLVWRSYILLHQCLDDGDTVLHYLWFLIYSIKHYPSFEQGMEYLSLISNYVPDVNLNSLRSVKKQCLLYTILRSPMFMKMTFVGDCQVPHKFNDVTPLNYFLHGNYEYSLGNESGAEDNYHEFLKLVADNGEKVDPIYVDRAFFRLAMSSKTVASGLHDLLSSEEIQNHTSEDVALCKHYLSATVTDKNAALSRLLEDANTLTTDCESIFPALFSTLKDADISQLPSTTRERYAEFLSRSVVRHLLDIPSTNRKFSFPLCNEEMLNDLTSNVVSLLGVNDIKLLSLCGPFGKELMELLCRGGKCSS